MLHLTPEAQAVGMTEAQAEKLSAIHTRALLAAREGKSLSKTDLTYALKLFDRLSTVVDFEEERRWQAECVRKQVTT